ncbi:50S ribosomal protein YmL27 [Aspergillus crustosus]
MVRPTQPMMARLRLTTKQVNGGYYKGNRTGSTGYFAKNGSYVIDWKKVRTYAVPEGLKDFKLTPFVTKLMTPTRNKYTSEVMQGSKTRTVERALGPRDYLQLWASDNGQEVLEEERKVEAAERAYQAKKARRAEKTAKKFKTPETSEAPRPADAPKATETVETTQ